MQILGVLIKTKKETEKEKGTRNERETQKSNKHVCLVQHSLDGDGSSYPLSPFCSGTLCGLSMGCIYNCCHSLWESLCAVYCCIQSTLFSWSHPSPLPLTAFLSSVSHEGRESMNVFHLQLGVPRIFVLVPVYCRRKHICPSKTLISGCSRMSLGVTLLLLPFNRTIVFGFPQSHWPIQSHILGNQCIVRQGFHFMGGALNVSI